MSPHLTLARIKEGERCIGHALAKSGVMGRSLSLGSLAVESVGLMKSELRSTGSVHTKLWEVRLRATDPHVRKRIQSHLPGDDFFRVRGFTRGPKRVPRIPPPQPSPR